MLLKAGADVNKKDPLKGSTALMHTTRNNWANFIENLLKVGANVNAQNNTTSTALHYAALDSAATLHARGLDGYTVYQHKFMSIKSMSSLKPGATRCHGTRIARGVPLPVYTNLDLYSGFWCTSHCVVF